MRKTTLLAALFSAAFILPAIAQADPLPRIDERILEGCDTNFTTTDLSRRYACSNGDYLMFQQSPNGLVLVRIPAPQVAPAPPPVTRTSAPGFQEPPVPIGVDSRQWRCVTGTGSNAALQRCTFDTVLNDRGTYSPTNQSRWQVFTMSGQPVSQPVQPATPVVVYNSPSQQPVGPGFAGTSSTPPPSMRLQHEPTSEMVLIRDPVTGSLYTASYQKPPTLGEAIMCFVLCGAAYGPGYVGSNGTFVTNGGDNSPNFVTNGRGSRFNTCNSVPNQPGGGGQQRRNC